MLLPLVFHLQNTIHNIHKRKHDQQLSCPTTAIAKCGHAMILCGLYFCFTLPGYHQTALRVSQKRKLQVKQATLHTWATASGSYGRFLIYSRLYENYRSSKQLTVILHTWATVYKWYGRFLIHSCGYAKPEVCDRLSSTFSFYPILIPYLIYKRERV
jgi:hypothetical protein